MQLELVDLAFILFSLFGLVFIRYFSTSQLIKLSFVIVFCLIIIQFLIYQIETTCIHPKPQQSNPSHLIILQHGYLASWISNKPLIDSIKHHIDLNFATNSKTYLIHAVQSNSDDFVFGCFKTQDGIDSGGIRVYDDIQAILHQYPTITEISMIGGSLGGLYNRYAASLLFNEQATQKEKPKIIGKNFITLATPHFGVSDFMSDQSQPILFAIGQYLHSINLLPLTLAQMAKFDTIEQLRNKSLLDAMNTEGMIDIYYLLYQY